MCGGSTASTGLRFSSPHRTACPRACFRIRCNGRFQPVGFLREAMGALLRAFGGDTVMLGFSLPDFAFLLCRQLFEVSINDLGYVLKFFLVLLKPLLQIGLFRTTQLIEAKTL